MPKQNGLGLEYWLSGFDLGNDIREFKMACPQALHDVTGIDKKAPERIGGLRDGSLDLTVFFNPAAGRAHPRFSTLPSTDQLSTIAVGTTLGNPVLSAWSKQINYDPARANDGMLTFAAQMQGNGYGFEWGQLLTAGKRTDGGATNGTGLDLGSVSPGAFGAQFYLQVFAFTGTSATVKVQHSDDNGGTDPYADLAGAAFTAVAAAPNWQRVPTAAIAVKRWLRVVTTGTFSNVQFAVAGARNPVATAF